MRVNKYDPTIFPQNFRTGWAAINTIFECLMQTIIHLASCDIRHVKQDIETNGGLKTASNDISASRQVNNEIL